MTAPSPTMVWCEQCHASVVCDVISNTGVRWYYYLRCGHVTEVVGKQGDKLWERAS